MWHGAARIHAAGVSQGLPLAAPRALLRSQKKAPPKAGLKVRTAAGVLPRFDSEVTFSTPHAANVKQAAAGLPGLGAGR